MYVREYWPAGFHQLQRILEILHNLKLICWELWYGWYSHAEFLVSTVGPFLGVPVMVPNIGESTFFGCPIEGTAKKTMGRSKDFRSLCT